MLKRDLEMLLFPFVSLVLVADLSLLILIEYSDAKCEVTRLAILPICISYVRKDLLPVTDNL